ncbi:protein tyrosine phosphatase domain-containing protein 1 [Chanos chanos]|uniref:Protein tyrosine phosphatase domain-containing protein 1 n=1 Tax=Chanos chanos TaxID=29144 RepID=A0A6J2UX41_CHACN|nr:protein tyrosine phosphatase domain-containing protein 1-like [Chanos chanos]
MEFVSLGRSSVPRAKYTVVGETLRHIIPSDLQCSIGCGGRACKYENPDYWSEDKQAIKGLYSSWVTDNLLAMSRPSTELIEKYQIIDQFQRCGVRTVINLQRPGEHANCGFPLEPESGFTYRPETFMEAGIYFYNFGWNDYGVASLTAILDMVKVMSFALQEGKMAIHCHAGLGRTGVVLACFLVFTSRMTADQAIVYVRSKRPNSIQTRGQLMCVREFAQFLVPLRNVFAYAEPKASPVNLSQYLVRQQHMLHGYERRNLRYLPKLIQMVCRLLLDIAENRQVIEEDVLEVPDMTTEVEWNIMNCRMQHFAFGMNGKGITGIQPRLPGLPTKPQPPLHYVRKSLSYSDSDLRRLASSLNLLGDPLTVLANVPSDHSVVSQNTSQANEGTNDEGQTYSTIGSVWDLKTLMDRREGSPLLKKRRQSVLQRSQSLLVSDKNSMANSSATVSAWKKEHEEKVKQAGAVGKATLKNGQLGKREEEEDRSEVPFITIQTELTLEARHLLVAQSLAVDLDQDGDEEQRQKVCAWQSDLNYQGAWERLCLERDPFILSGIMWSWLEQLREPIISAQEIQTLHNSRDDPKTVLNCLDQAPRETIVCIMNCFAHLLTIPEEVESAFLERTVKAFTKVEISGEGKKTYEKMILVLKPLLQDMRMTVMDELVMQSV